MRSFKARLKTVDPLLWKVGPHLDLGFHNPAARVLIFMRWGRPAGKPERRATGNPGKSETRQPLLTTRSPSQSIGSSARLDELVDCPV